jgi:hypothetical protein
MPSKARYVPVKLSSRATWVRQIKATRQRLQERRADHGVSHLPFTSLAAHRSTWPTRVLAGTLDV